MMKLLSSLLILLLTVTRTDTQTQNCSANNCISFTVGEGTGCAWMCSYCANQLGTNNYYFTTDVCKYETGGCVGSPQVGTLYTCCSN
jgi:hypothetical protein